MPVLITETPIKPIPLIPPRKLWTRAECAALEAAGVQETLELVEGELIDKTGKNWPRITGTEFLHLWFLQTFGPGLVAMEATIDVAPADIPTSEPQPAVVVLKRSIRGLRSNPTPADIVLVAEVSDSTLVFDLSIKAALYARAGIAEYWVLDINARRLIVQRDPREGKYRSVAAYSEGESVSPLAAPHASLRPGKLF